MSTGSLIFSVRSATAVSNATTCVRIEGIEASTVPKTPEYTTEAPIEPDRSTQTITDFS